MSQESLEFLAQEASRSLEWALKALPALRAILSQTYPERSVGAFTAVTDRRTLTAKSPANTRVLGL